MIKLKPLLHESVNVKDIIRKYPVAGSMVDGRSVLPNVDNMSSIGASLYHYGILRKIREVPMSDFYATGKHYSSRGTDRIKELAAEIQQSNEISPLIVVIDSKGPYVLEGATRLEALHILGAESFPALVVVDYD